MNRKLFLLILIALTIAGCRSVDQAVPIEREAAPRNIIVVIGDGMGATHFTVLDRIRGEESTLRRFASSALVTTHSASSLVTDSGAAATAMASGVKTTNGALSVTPEGEPVETVLEIAQKRGMMTGLITTTRFWDATPAAFAAHVLSRTNTPVIVDQMLSSGVDLVISNGAERLERDGVPPIDQLGAQYGYEAVTTPEDLLPTDDKILAVFIGDELELDNPAAPLSHLTRYALDHLAGDPDGFFLVIESEGTDGASHKNRTEETLASLRRLDEAVSIALDYAETSGDTLVLFVGDHETGGLEIASPDEGGGLNLKWSTGHHTGQALPLLAFGPGANRFTGWIDNTDIGKWLKEAVGR